MNTISVGGTKITKLRYAEDTVLFSTTPDALNNRVQQQALNRDCATYYKNVQLMLPKQISWNLTNCKKIITFI